MNWLDFVILGILIASMLWGLKTGIFVAGIYGIAILVGWRISGDVSQFVGEFIGDALGSNSSSAKAISELSGINLSVDTIATVAAFVVVLILTLIITNVVLKFIGPLLAVIDVATLGMGRIAGIILGLIIGVIISSITISGLTRLAYDFHEIPELPGSSLVSAGEVISVEGIDAKIENTRTSIETALLGSRLAPIFVKTLQITPDNSFGIIPTDYMTAIKILDSKLD
ncbi:MAG: CvpA family protein [SAR202 cluster bacterium]|nr:CvpA family protein [SAR202 cluster bacterium]